MYSRGLGSPNQQFWDPMILGDGIKHDKKRTESRKQPQDLDMHDLGGVLSWESPESMLRVTSYLEHRQRCEPVENRELYCVENPLVGKNGPKRCS